MPTISDNIAKTKNNLKPTIKPPVIDPRLMVYLFDSNLKYYRENQYDIYQEKEHILFNLLAVVVVVIVVVVVVVAVVAVVVV